MARRATFRVAVLAWLRRRRRATFCVVGRDLRASQAGLRPSSFRLAELRRDTVGDVALPGRSG